MSFSLLEYKTSYNLGDEIQSIAAAQFLPFINYTVDRDSYQTSLCDPPPSKILLNGWFHHVYSKFPPPSFLTPLFISFHCNDADSQRNQMYSCLKRTHEGKPKLTSYYDYLKKHEPIGCRDLHTLQIIESAGIKGYFSGCLTLTLKHSGLPRTNEILVIDCSPEILDRLIPKAQQENFIFLKQAVVDDYTHGQKMQLAQEFLNRIARAKLVFTSRLHTIIPCLAYETPGVLLHQNLNDIRFSGWLPFVPHFDLTCKYSSFNMETCFQQTRHPQIQQMINRLTKEVKTFIGPIPLPFYQQLSNQPFLTKDGNSIIVCCMNRNEHLKISLPSWIQAKPNEIVIVDYGSSEPLQPYINEMNAKNNGIVKLIRIQNVKEWNLTRAYNLALRLTSYNKILKLDCDSILSSDFYCFHNLNTNLFFAGDWRKARDTNETHTNGLIYIHKLNLLKIGGYNELITTYGYDDDDLYNRLTKSLHLERKLLSLDCVKHISHKNEDRILYQPQILYPLDVEIEINRLISERIGWTIDTYAQFELFKDNSNYYEGKYQYSVQLDTLIRAELTEQAKKNRLRKKFYLVAQNGLGNRLRAFASAYLIAKSTNRQLFVIWVMDHHCGAAFEDLFEALQDVTILSNVFTHHFTKPDLYDCYDYTKAQTYIDDTSTRDIYVASACCLKNKHTSYAKESAFLKQLTPIHDIQDQINQFSTIHQFECNEIIGVHIRMGQSGLPCEDTSNYKEESKTQIEKWRELSNYTIFAREIKRMHAENCKRIFFVCCDQDSILQCLQEECKECTFIATPKKIFDRSKEQVQSGLIDLWLLSKTKEMLGSNWSSFTEMAHKIGSNKLRLAGIDFK